MWKGYKEKYQNQLTFLADNNIPMQDIHTSGHADVPTLKKIVAGLKPKIIIPIHTFYPQKFMQMFDNVVCLNDGDLFEIPIK